MVDKLLEFVGKKYSKHHAQINIFLVLTIIVLCVFGVLWKKQYDEKDAAHLAGTALVEKQVASATADLQRLKELAAREFELQQKSQMQLGTILSREAAGLMIAAEHVADTAARLDKTLSGLP